MSDTRGRQGGEDPVAARIERILEEKRRENERVLGGLKGARDAWEGLTKEVDVAVGEEFDLLATEREAVLAAKERLQETEVAPTDEGFVVGGRIFEKERKLGLPHVAVRVVREAEGQEEVLGETATDEMGNFREVLPLRMVEALGTGRHTIRVEALVKPGKKPIVAEEKLIRVEPGQAVEMNLGVPAGRRVAGRVAVASSIVDSVEQSVELVERRLESMKAAHTALTRFAELTREELEELRKDLSTGPPEPTAAVAVAGIEPPPSRGGQRPERRRPERSPPTTSTPLESVRGIGPVRAGRLRAAGIPDLETFLRTDTATLVRIMGFDANVAKEEAERILREHEAAAGKRRAPTRRKPGPKRRAARKKPSARRRPPRRGRPQ